ncbi:MAG: chalcone isomerase family protein [Burkholderiales bacterium]
MSPNTRWRGPRPAGARTGILALATLALAVLAPFAHATADRAPPLPPDVARVAPGLRPLGGGQLTWFGLAVYDGWYWVAARGWPDAAPYALDLHYHRDLVGARIAERSVEEIAKLGYGTAAERARWGERMAKIFPDVRRGDRLTGVSLDGGVVRFFHNGAPIGDIADPEFAHAFFAIWLHPRSTRADFREKLLGRP